MDWLQILANFGLPTLMVLALGVASWRVLIWVGREMVIPLRDRVLLRVGDFFDRLDGTLSKVERNLEAATESLERHTSILERIEADSMRNTSDIDELRQEIRRGGKS